MGGTKKFKRRCQEVTLKDKRLTEHRVGEGMSGAHGVQKKSKEKRSRSTAKGFPARKGKKNVTLFQCQKPVWGERDYKGGGC